MFYEVFPHLLLNSDAACIPFLSRDLCGPQVLATHHLHARPFLKVLTDSSALTWIPPLAAFHACSWIGRPQAFMIAYTNDYH